MSIEPEEEVAKLFVLRLSYACLLRKLPAHDPQAKGQFLFVHLPSSVALRCAERETGENLANILLSTSLLPSTFDSKSFQNCWRLCETDEAASNGRGERLYSAARPRGQSMTVLHTFCAAHKVHTSATKTMELSHFAPLLSGMVHVLKVCWDRRILQAFYTALHQHVVKNLQWTPKDVVKLTLGATQYKDAILEHFAPPVKKRRLRALTFHVASSLLNADWRSSQLQHFCVGCCQSKEECITKVSKSLVQLARGLRVSMLCKNNWSDWPKHMMWFGLLSHLHGLLRPVLLQTLSPFRSVLDRELAEHEGVDQGNVQEGDDIMAAQHECRFRVLEPWRLGARFVFA